MKAFLRLLLPALLATLLAGCSHMGAGVGVSGGSSGNVNVGGGVNIRLYTPLQQEPR